MSGEKTKIRLTSLDITALVTELKQKLIGLRVSNIYDINQKTYLFKLARGETKEFLLIENGIRFHTTDIQQEKSKMPSGFTMKFRKFLRSKRLEDIKQIGVERVIILTFGSGESTNHIILEMYSSGNIILTDKDFNIILLMRQHQFTETIKTAIGERYPFEQAANLYLEKFDTSETVIEELIKQKEISEENNEEEDKKKNNEKKNEAEEDKDGDEADKKKKNKQKKDTKDGKNKDQDKQKKDSKKSNAAKATKGFKLREIVFKIVPSLHNPVIDHIISSNGLNPNQKVTVADVAIVKQMADKCKDLILDFQKTVHQGYLIVSDKKDVKHRPVKQEQQQIEAGGEKEDEIQTEKAKEEKKEEEKEKYFDFSPLYLTCHEGKRFIENNSFNASVDKYFQVMASKIQEEQNDVESIAWKKYENIKNDQLNRIQKLKNEQEEYVVKAQLIEMNIDYVDAIINIIKTLKSSGESWDKITKMINEGKKNGDPMANLIHSLDFENNEVSVYLGDPCDDMEELTVVAVDITCSAHQNARNYYENKKRNIIKEKKTLDASKLALKQAEKTALKEIENLKLKNNVVNTRKQYWFEKFYWFISSENYLVISGRDMQQNEIIVKKYMRKGDIYMHADFHGAASTVIKNPFKDVPVSQQTIEEAAIATICRSKAWEAKIIASAWWVYDHQVSKRAETGEFLPSGSFMIRGKKNFIYPARMEMGCTLLYKLDDQFVEKHLNDRRRKEKDDNTTIVSGLQIDNQNDFDDTNFEIRPNQQLDPTSSEQGSAVGTQDPFAQQSQNKIEQVPILLQKASTSVIDEEVTMIKLNVPPQPKPKNAQQIQKEIQQAKQKNKQQQKDDKNQSKNGNDAGKKSKDPKDGKKKDSKKNESSSESDKEDEKQNNNNKPVPRGKKNKIKKMQEKYADQDEEERQLRMHLIGAKQMKDVKIKEDQAFSKKNNNNKEKDGKGKNSKDKDNKPQKQEEEEEELEIPCGVITKKADDQISKGSIEVEVCEDLSLNQIPSKITEQLSAVDLNKDQAEAEEIDLQKPQQQEASQEPKPAQQKENEDELSNPEDNDNEEDDELAEQKASEQNKIDEDVKDEVIDSELQELSRLATFTYPEETFSFTLLMCAPYNTISILNSKYKIKLVPGTLKKGKAAKSIVHFFQSSKDTNQQEKKCLKNMTEQEIINCIIGNVKLAGAGLQKIKDKEKQAKKQARKTKDAASEKK